MHRTIAVKARLSPYTHRRLNLALEQSRSIHNWCMMEKDYLYSLSGHDLSAFDLGKKFTKIRRSNAAFQFLRRAVQNAVIHRVDRTFKWFFKHGGRPRYKSYQRYRTIEIDDPTVCRQMFNGKSVRVKGIGTFRLTHRDRLPENKELKAIRITRKPRGVYVQLVYKLPDVPFKTVTNLVGIDLGISNRVMLSDGTFVERRITDDAEQRRIQRSIARKIKGSSSRRRAVHALRRLKQKEYDANKGWVQRTASQIIKRFDGVAIEDLQVSNMLRHPTLAKSISEQTWSTFTSTLGHIAENAGVRVVKVDPRNTSQLCSNCGVIVKKDLSVRVHSCECGLTIDRDLNAAINVRRKGFPSLATAGIFAVAPVAGRTSDSLGLLGAEKQCARFASST